MYYLKIKNGKIEVHANLGDLDAPAALITVSAAEAARHLYEMGVSDWMNSSTMDFSHEHGWSDTTGMSAAEAVSAELSKLENADA